MTIRISWRAFVAALSLALNVALLAIILALVATGCTLAATTDVAPPAPGEIPARTCYLNAQTYWQSITVTTPHDAGALTAAYRRFAHCAAVAVKTGAVVRGVGRIPWSAEYFADTVGAAYAQTSLAGADLAHRCAHTRLAYALTQQAEQTLSDEPEAQSSEFAQFLGTLDGTLKRAVGDCK